MNFWTLDAALTKAGRAATATRAAYMRSRSGARGTAYEAAEAAYRAALRAYQAAEPGYIRAQLYRNGAAALVGPQRAARAVRQFSFNF